MAGSSLIPDSIKDTLGDVLTTYADLQKIKIQSQLAKAQASLSWYDAANITPEQAAQLGNRTMAVPYQSSNSGLLLIGAALVGVVALVMIAK